jgi:hypothetical protein
MNRPGVDREIVTGTSPKHKLIPLYACGIKQTSKEEINEFLSFLAFP